MPTATYIALANLTLTGTDATIDFTNIPNTYRDLVLVVTYSTNNLSDILVEFNSDATNHYSIVEMRGDGSSAFSASFTRTGAYLGFSNQSVIQSSIMHIMDYSATDKHKTTLSRPNSTLKDVAAYASRWPNTNAITSIKIKAGASFVSGDTFALYGIVS